MVKTARFVFDTRGDTDIRDITEEVAQAVTESGLQAGVATVFILGSTAALTTVEYEPGLVADLQRVFEQIAPEDAVYQHEERWHDDNGHAHVRATLLGPSLSVPFNAGRLELGTWQQIVALDFDTRPRQRTVVVQMVGE
ncbi:MAG TPA: secondary thiamine-phosphate synthase enzyme YjbQ [Chthonomonadaceae bacterium]|nr:secondary thiamine-phosphate synthase enzyme YjbQ [Chthonomonadaceae bacterium]